MKGCRPSSSTPLQIRHRPVQKAQGQKKALPPVTPLGTNRRGISKAAQKERWKPPPFLMMRNINMPSFPSLMVQRYNKILRPSKI